MKYYRFFLFILFVFCGLNTELFAQYGTQFDNWGFEEWTTRQTEAVSEPVHWHSGGTATGTFSGFLSNQIEESGHLRPGSTGTKSVRIFPNSVLGVTANGTLTNGRMNAGSMSATGTGNYNYTQRANEAFNTPINIMPDSITLWVCFRSESSTQNANLHAAVHGDADYKFIANGTEEPLNQLVGSARYNFQRTSPANGTYVWRRLSVPFEKDGVCNDPRYILLSLTTNEIPGEGSTNDDLFVDDILLVYNPTLSLGQLASTQYYCDESINIPFTLSGTMSVGNLNAEANDVIVQLSDENGDFANPTEIGRLKSDGDGSLTATIPEVNSGEHYKVRVVSTNYPMIGGNIQEISIINTNGTEETPLRCEVYPNPVTSTLHISSRVQPQHVQLYDLTGRLLMDSQSVTLDLSRFDTGVYLLRIDLGTQLITRRIVKL